MAQATGCSRSAMPAGPWSHDELVTYAGRWLRVAAVVVAATLGLRIVVAPDAIFASLIAAGIDAALLGGLCVALAAPDRSRPVRRIAGIVTGTCVLIYGTLVFWHAFFLDINTDYRFSAASLSLDAVLFFAREMIPLRGWLAFAAVAGLAAAASRWRGIDRVLPARVLDASRRVRLATGLLACTLAVGFVAVASPDHPLAATLADLRGRSMEPTIYAGETTLRTAPLDLRSAAPGAVLSRYERVLVFVMEGMSRSEFEAALDSLPLEDGFFREIGPFATRYAGLYTVNQESRTARMAMIHSLMIPYEAYVPDWRERFGHVAAGGGLVAHLNASGWRTVFAIPMSEPPLDLRELPWTGRVQLDPREWGRPGFTCLAPTEFDRGCEDTILLDRIEALLDEPGPLFLFQHFLFGHTSRWEETTGVHRVVYYDRYLKRVYDALRRRNLLEETLVIVTSDHGPRLLARLVDPASYEVPLWLVHPSFPGETRTGHFSNTEFRDLVLETMQTGAPPVARHNPWVVAMGPSARSMFMCADANGRFGFYRIAGRNRATALRVTSDNPPFWSACVATFFCYRRAFESSRDQAPAAAARRRGTVANAAARCEDTLTARHVP